MEVQYLAARHSADLDARDRFVERAGGVIVRVRDGDDGADGEGKASVDDRFRVGSVTKTS